MKIRFHIKHPLRDPRGLMNLKQPAQKWLGALMGALGDQLNADPGARSITMQVDTNDIQGVMIEFRVTHIPGVIETKRLEWRVE